MDYRSIVLAIRRNFASDIEKRFKIGQLVDSALEGGANLGGRIRLVPNVRLRPPRARRRLCSDGPGREGNVAEMPKPCVCMPGQTLPARCRTCPQWDQPLPPMVIERLPDYPHLALVTVDGRVHCETWESAKAVLDYIERRSGR